MKGPCIQLIARGQFNDNTQIHDCNTTTNMLNHRKIVSNEEIRQVKLFLQFLKQVNHLGLDRNIQRRDWLITNNKGRLQCERTRNTNTLALPAGEFVWITTRKRRIEIHNFKQVINTILDLLPLGNIMHDKWFPYNIGDGHARV